MPQPDLTDMELSTVDQAPQDTWLGNPSNRSQEKKGLYTNRRTDWTTIHEVLIILWPGMTISELRHTLDAVYGFQATSEAMTTRRISFSDILLGSTNTRRGLRPGKKKENFREKRDQVYLL